MAATKPRAADRQAACKKLVKELKKRYKGPAPQDDRPVLDWLIYAVCLEDSDPAAAEAAHQALYASFHDLNEIRVSTISELATVFNGQDQPELRAHRVRSSLQHVFEKFFAFDLEPIRRQTLEAAGKQLARMKDLSHFVRSYVLQMALDTHMVPMDQAMTDAAVWLGLVPPGSTPEQASETLKPALRKSEAQQFCHLLHQLATDPALRETFNPQKHPPPEGGYDLRDAVERLGELFRQAGKRKKAPSRKKTAARAGAKKAARSRAASAGKTRKKAASPRKKR